MKNLQSRINHSILYVNITFKRIYLRYDFTKGYVKNFVKKKTDESTKKTYLINHKRKLVPGSHKGKQTERKRIGN